MFLRWAMWTAGLLFIFHFNIFFVIHRYPLQISRCIIYWMSYLNISLIMRSTCLLSWLHLCRDLKTFKMSKTSWTKHRLNNNHHVQREKRAKEKWIDIWCKWIRENEFTIIISTCSRWNKSSIFFCLVQLCFFCLR